jgi:peroxiredoxin
MRPIEWKVTMKNSTNRKRVLWSLFLLLLCLWFSGPALADSRVHSLSKRKKAPDFSLIDINAQTHHLSDYRGQVVLVNFWATWCPPCRDEMPSMQRLWETLKEKGFTILAIDVGENGEQILPFVMEHDLEFPILMDPNSKTARAWSVRGMPTSFLVDPQGNLAFQAIGGREWDDPAIIEIIEKMLAKP